MNTTDTLRHHLDTIAAATATAAEALCDGAAIDLSPAVLANRLLDLAPDRLATTASAR
jgi:hypothetical protein